MTYPQVLSEDASLEAALAGRSITRVGEGEWKLAVCGWDLKSQVHHPRLAAEILDILARPTVALACIPRLWKGMPNEGFWSRFREPRYVKTCGLAEYGSAFISRPDVVHGIDRPDYWARAEQLWAGRDVVLASRSTKVLKLSAAHAVRFVECPAIGAYAEIDRIEAEIGTPDGPVLLAIGATATVLAERLARKGVHAIDVGHLGAFMSAAGAYSLERSELISPAYVEQNRLLHKTGAYGGSGRKRVGEVMAYAAEISAASVLDYGCGLGTLRTGMVAAGFKGSIAEYDPAVKGKGGLPKPADLVACTDVLEHVEPEKLGAVLAHLKTLTAKAAFFVIALRKAQKVLPDGRNAHLIIRDAGWWLAQLAAAGFVVARMEGKEGYDLKLWLRK